MKEEEILALENKLEAEKNLFLKRLGAEEEKIERIKRIETVSELLPSPSGIFRKRCPICNKVIKSKDYLKFGYRFQIFLV